MFKSALPFIVIVIVFIGVVSCDKANEANMNAVSKPHTISVYSGSGDPVRVFHTESHVERTDGGDFYFMDKDTGKLVQVTGTVVITQD